MFDEEFNRALNERYVSLVRSVIAMAVVDLVALRHRRVMQSYLNRWRRSEKGYGGRWPAWRLERWFAEQEREIVDFLSNGGGELARAAGCYHYVRLLQSRQKIQWCRLRRAAELSFRRAGRRDGA